MTRTNRDVRALWPSCLSIIALCVAPSCASEREDSAAPVLDDASEALTQAELDCERAKRECLIPADCDPDARDVCESAFRACREPVRDERKRVRELCRAQRDACEAAATSEAELYDCHVAEHVCKLPVDPPEAICHVDALRCIWDARTDSVAPDDDDDAGLPPADHHTAEHACHEQERVCKESLRLDRRDLPEAPKCEHCKPKKPAPISPGTAEHFECVRVKRECLIAADCDAVASAACESAYHACAEPLRAERERVHALCHAERESCEAAAVDDPSHHACHIAEHRCTLAVDPPEAICRIEAHECRWAAHIADPMPPAPPHGPNAADHACREAEHACVEVRRLHPEDLPEAPLCSIPPECRP